VFLVALFASVLVVKMSAGAPGAAAVSNQKYGGLPSWLPKATVPVNTVLDASPTHPQLGIEGNTMRVTLRGSVILVTMSGPTVPPFTTPPPPVTTATVTLTFVLQSGHVPIRAKDFSLLDGNGVALQPQSFVGGRLAVAPSPGQPVSVRIREVMAVGAGSIKWSPGGATVAEWEFTVEND
jgi:hypothetical protein